MSSVLGSLRKLVLGETWLLPAAVAILVGAAVGLRELAPRMWESVGGLFLLAGCVGIVLLVARAPATPRAAAGPPSG